ncbi:MAG TPA: hypothetical protein PLI70_05785, partial [Gemmatimonadales bacterium]|nr:hypothetical protein [Gemmatimonadales bacterium]
MSLARPLLLLLLLPLVWWWWRRRHPSPGLPYSDVSLPAAMGGPPWWLRLPPILRTLALACFIVG